ncbi:hypothetical protein K9L16_02075 [Candidatus Pacearchaeota archaeon]|nr:hypothetical protein [Candidatus Pacearchaeota archaeon]
MADTIDTVKKTIEEGLEKAEEVVEKVEDAIESKIKKKKSEEKSSEKKDSKSKQEIKEASAEEAKAESTTKEAELEEKKKKLLEKAAKLKEKVSEGKISSEELKEKVKAKKKSDMLVPLEEYVKAGIYLGTRAVTPDMKKYVYRRRADGLAIFNTDIIDEKLKEGIEFLSKFEPEDIIVVCKRQSGWKVIEMFSRLTGIRAFTKKYPAGILTNTSLPDFFENELTIITDQWVDKNALQDTLNVNKKVLMVCDTNNFAKGADQIIIGNNKSPRSIGLIYYLLTRGYMKAHNMDTSEIPDLEWWTSEGD